MKKFLLGLAVVFTFSNSFAQEEGESAGKAEKASDVTYVSKTATISKYHTQVELESLGKLELTELYMERVVVLSETVPYLALSFQPAGATLEDLGIPSSKSNTAHMEVEVKNKEGYITHVKETLHDITPYADKENIIWCILFLEETIHKIEKSNGGH